MEWAEMDANSGPVEWMDVEMEMHGRYKGTVHDPFKELLRALNIASAKP